MRGLLLPRPAALAALVAGLLAVVVALAVMTVARPTSSVTATARLEGRAPLALTAPGVLESRPGPVVVRARGKGDVLLAVGRQEDVRAWAADAARTTITELSSPQALATEAADGTSTVPDPAGSDLWVQQSTGDGSAALTWPATDGAWLLLAAGDGTGPAPSRVTLSWQQEAAPGWALPLLVAGALVGLLGLASLLLRRRAGATAGARGDRR